MKIQSISDIITNSSSEVFTITTEASAYVVEDLLHSALRCWGYTEEDIRDSSIGGCVYTNDDGEVIISYGVICNVNENIRDFLDGVFGRKNVKAHYYG